MYKECCNVENKRDFNCSCLSLKKNYWKKEVKVINGWNIVAAVKIGHTDCTELNCTQAMSTFEVFHPTSSCLLVPSIYWCDVQQRLAKSRLLSAGNKRRGQVCLCRKPENRLWSSKWRLVDYRLECHFSCHKTRADAVFGGQSESRNFAPLQRGLRDEPQTHLRMRVNAY